MTFFDSSAAICFAPGDFFGDLLVELLLCLHDRFLTGAHLGLWLDRLVTAAMIPSMPAGKLHLGISGLQKQDTRPFA